MNYFLLFLLLLSTPAFAGGYYEPHIDTYDPASGLYYKAVQDHTTEGGFLSSKSSRNTVTNINIFLISANLPQIVKTTYLVTVAC